MSTSTSLESLLAKALDLAAARQNLELLWTLRRAIAAFSRDGGGTEEQRREVASALRCDASAARGSGKQLRKAVAANVARIVKALSVTEDGALQWQSTELEASSWIHSVTPATEFEQRYCAHQQMQEMVEEGHVREKGRSWYEVASLPASRLFPAADTKEAKALKGRSSSKGKGNAAARCTDGGAARDKGNEAFRAKRYQTAEAWYGRAIDLLRREIGAASTSNGDNNDRRAVLLAKTLTNRCLVRQTMARQLRRAALGFNAPAVALLAAGEADAAAAQEADPKWFKAARLRAECCLLRSLDRCDEAVEVLRKALTEATAAEAAARNAFGPFSGTAARNQTAMRAAVETACAAETDVTQLTKALAEAELVAKHVGRDSPVGKEAGQRPSEGGTKGKGLIDLERGLRFCIGRICALAMAPPNFDDFEKEKEEDDDDDDDDDGDLLKDLVESVMGAEAASSSDDNDHNAVSEGRKSSAKAVGDAIALHLRALRMLLQLPYQDRGRYAPVTAKMLGEVQFNLHCAARHMPLSAASAASAASHGAGLYTLLFSRELWVSYKVSRDGAKSNWEDPILVRDPVEEAAEDERRRRMGLGSSVATDVASMRSMAGSMVLGVQPTSQSRDDSNMCLNFFAAPLLVRLVRTDRRDTTSKSSCSSSSTGNKNSNNNKNRNDGGGGGSKGKESLGPIAEQALLQLLKQNDDSDGKNFGSESLAYALKGCSGVATYGWPEDLTLQRRFLRCGIDLGTLRGGTGGGAIGDERSRERRLNSTALAPLRFLLDEALDESKTQESMVGIMEAQLLSRVGSAGWRRLPLCFLCTCLERWCLKQFDYMDDDDNDDDDDAKGVQSKKKKSSTYVAARQRLSTESAPVEDTREQLCCRTFADILAAVFADANVAPEVAEASVLVGVDHQRSEQQNGSPSVSDLVLQHRSSIAGVGSAAAQAAARAAGADDNTVVHAAAIGSSAAVGSAEGVAKAVKMAKEAGADVAVVKAAAAAAEKAAAAAGGGDQGRQFLTAAAARVADQHPGLAPQMQGASNFLRGGGRAAGGGAAAGAVRIMVLRIKAASGGDQLRFWSDAFNMATEDEMTAEMTERRREQLQGKPPNSWTPAGVTPYALPLAGLPPGTDARRAPCPHGTGHPYIFGRNLVQSLLRGASFGRFFLHRVEQAFEKRPEGTSARVLVDAVARKWKQLGRERRAGFRWESFSAAEKAAISKKLDDPDNGDPSTAEPVSRRAAAANSSGGGSGKRKGGKNNKGGGGGGGGASGAAGGKGEAEAAAAAAAGGGSSFSSFSKVVLEAGARAANAQAVPVAAALEVASCAVCGAKPSDGPGIRLQKCSGCRSIHYCSKEHQTGHWREHKAECRRISAAAAAAAGRK